MALLQGFNDESAPSAKRRKMDHQTANEDSSQDLSEDENQDKDMVYEAEEPDNEIEVQSDDSGDEEQDSTEPFDTHFAHPDEERCLNRVEAAKKGEWSTKRAMVQPWRATFQTPGSDESSDIPQPATGLESFNLKQKLRDIAIKKMLKFGDIEKSLGPLLFNYRDVLHCDRTVRNSRAMRQMVCLHALNHVFK